MKKIPKPEDDFLSDDEVGAILKNMQQQYAMLWYELQIHEMEIEKKRRLEEDKERPFFYG